MNNNNNDFDEVADLRRKNKELNDQMIDLAIQLRNERQRNRDLLTITTSAPTDKRLKPKMDYNSKEYLSAINICKAVCADYQINREDLFSPRRLPILVDARQVCFLLIHQITGCGLQSIADIFGKRTHSTVIYGIRSVKAHEDTDPMFHERIKRIRAAITPLGCDPAPEHSSTQTDRPDSESCNHG